MKFLNYLPILFQAKLNKFNCSPVLHWLNEKLIVHKIIGLISSSFQGPQILTLLKGQFFKNGIAQQTPVIFDSILTVQYQI